MTMKASRLFTGRDRTVKPMVRSDLTLSTAVGLSARFPWILPAATVKLGRGAVHLVDGGYFDNSGIDTAQNLAEALAGLRFAYKTQSQLDIDDPRVRFEIYLILINGEFSDYTAEEAPLGRAVAGEVFSPIAGLLAARDARGDNTASKRRYFAEYRPNDRRLRCGSAVPGHLTGHAKSPGLRVEPRILRLNSTSPMMRAQLASPDECGNMDDLGSDDTKGFYSNMGGANRSGHIRDLNHGNSCQQCAITSLLTRGIEFGIPPASVYPCKTP